MSSVSPTALCWGRVWSCLMNVVVVGAGAVGLNLAQQLSHEGHDVAVVEQCADAADEMRDRLDAIVVCGEGSDPQTLEQAGIRAADMVVAVTDCDEVNVVVCLLADRFGVQRKIARVRATELSGANALFPDRPLPIDLMVNPEEHTVGLVLKMIETPGAVDVADFAGGEILLRGFDVPSDAPIANRKLAELRAAWEGEAFLVAGILRDGEVIIPSGEDVVRPHDEIFVIASRHTLPLLLPMVNRRSIEARRVIIYGGGRGGICLASALEERGLDVVVIEPDMARAEAAAAELERALVLRGQATEAELLDEADVETADFFIGAFEDDEPNLLAALVAKKNGARRTIVITSEPDYVPIMKSIDIDAVVNPRLVTVGAILRHVRRGRILSVAKLTESGAEAVESIAPAGSPIVGRPLRETKMPRGAIIGAIWRENEVVIPTGDTVVGPGDRVVAFVLPDAVDRVQALVSAG